MAMLHIWMRSTLRAGRDRSCQHCPGAGKPRLDRLSAAFETRPSGAPQAEVFYNAIDDLPHAEERRGAPRLEARTTVMQMESALAEIGNALSAAPSLLRHVPHEERGPDIDALEIVVERRMVGVLAGRVIGDRLEGARLDLGREPFLLR